MTSVRIVPVCAFVVAACGSDPHSVGLFGSEGGMTSAATESSSDTATTSRGSDRVPRRDCVGEDPDGPFFTDAVALVDVACDEFEPEG